MGGLTMNVEIKEVTPALAREWLGLNRINRSVRRGTVARYAHDMRSGDWQLNGEAIVLNGGALLDGQHRLLACVESGVTFDSVVVTDAPNEAMRTIDQGVSRNFSDVLKWQGRTDVTKLAAAVRLSWTWDSGLILKSLYPTVAQSLAWLEDNPRIASATRFAARLCGAPIRLSSSVGGSVYLKALESDEEQAAEFFDRLLDGEHLAHGDAVYTLRKVLMANAQRPHTKMRQNTMLAFTVRAWNAWVQNEPLERLTWGRADRELRFPVMVDAAGEPISAVQR